MGIREKAADLASELKRTSEFAELKQARAAVDKYPALKRELEGFGKKQAELYSSRLSPSEAASRLKQLEKSYAEMEKTPEIGRYLNATKAFNTMLSTVLKEIHTVIEAGLK